MKTGFNTQADNPDKHPLMPSGYPFHTYEVADDFDETDLLSQGYTFLTDADFATYITTFDLTAYNTAIAPTINQIVEQKIADAQAFGMQVLIDFATENVLMGITQAGQTIPVNLYLHRLGHYIGTGSLYAAIDEMNTIIADTTTAKTSLYPFVSDARITTYKNRIQTYLGVPLT